MKSKNRDFVEVIPESCEVGFEFSDKHTGDLAEIYKQLFRSLRTEVPIKSYELHEIAKIDLFGFLKFQTNI